jgi:hypothetical protein
VTVVDLTPVVEAATGAEELWPLPVYVEGGDHGWGVVLPDGLDVQRAPDRRHGAVRGRT